MSDLSLYSINWQDGMLITQRHLRDQEKYFEDLIRWHTLQTGDRFGLVRKSFSGKPPLSLNLSVSGNRLRVEVVRCQALTPDGHFIDINSTGADIIRGECEITEVVVPVFVGIDTRHKKPMGEPDPGEDVPRLPYLANTYFIFLGPPPNLPEGQYVQVAQLLINGNEVSYAPNYYPPCLTLSADERLAEKASELRNLMEGLLRLSTRAFSAISTTGALKGESTSLQLAVKETVYFFISHLASTLDDFVTGPNAGHPLYMNVLFKKVFRVFSTLLNMHPGLKDYLNERLFTKELGTDVGQFVSAAEGFIMAEYNHRDIGGQVHMIEDILLNVKNVMSFLAQTKREDLGEQAVATETLTYSGRTYRNVAYTGSRLEQVGELCYLLVNVADPCPMKDNVVLISKGLFGEGEWRNMQVRLGLNDSRGLGETDPVDVDTVAFGNKVALHPRDMLKSSSVRQITLIFRGASDPGKLGSMGKMDMLIYAL